jgi:hypothetical protein
MSTNREALSTEFVRALEQSYATGGGDALEAVRQNEPAKYLALIAQLMPRAAPAEPAPTSRYEKMTKEELIAFLGNDVLPLPEQIAANLAKYEKAIKEARRIVRQRKADDVVPEKFGMRTPRSRRAQMERFKRRDPAADR